jgi:hypothetical protein
MNSLPAKTLKSISSMKTRVLFGYCREAEETVTLGSDLMGRMVLGTESPSRLRAARNRFATWASESPDNTALQNVVAAIDARLKFLGKKACCGNHLKSR